MDQIREHVEVVGRPTVVRLEESAGEPWIRESYYVTDEVATHLQALRRVFSGDRGLGVFLIGSYGCGKSHFLAFLTQTLQGDPTAPEVVTLSLLNYPAEAALERVVTEALDMELSLGDRRPQWQSCLARHPRGLLIVLDELSEFLRSKPNRRAFAEDIRFLQFLGEWGQEQRLFVLAAMQESIEHTGDLEYGHYRKIKDRYPLRLLLSPAHIKDLIAHHVLKKNPGYEQAVETLARKLRRALPHAEMSYQDLEAIYPIHPATLELLEEVRDRFSQTRGVVDFVIRQLAGDPTRGITPFLDRKWGDLVTPDFIVTHFRDVFEVQAEFVGLAQKVLPWYEKQLPRLFEKEALQRLARKVLHLLVLTHLSPAREGLTVDEVWYWLLFAASKLDPERNRSILTSLLDQMVTNGRYVRCEQGRYSLDLHDDGAAALEQALQRELAELPRPSLVFELLANALLERPGAGAKIFNPFIVARDQWVKRPLVWHFHERQYSLFLGNDETLVADELSLCIRLPWGDGPPLPGSYTVVPAAIELSPALRELAALVRLRTRPLSPEVTALVERRIAERATLFHGQLRQAYASARLVAPTGRDEPLQPPGATELFEPWLDGIAVAMCRKRFASFEKVAPTHGPLPQEAYRAFMRFVTEHELGEPASDEWVDIIREAYLVRLGLLRHEGRGFTVPARIERNDQVQQVLLRLAGQPSPKQLYAHLAGPVWGLVPDQIHLLLIFLLIMGELDILKGKNGSYRSLFQTMPLPLQYDRIVSGHALSTDQLHALTVLSQNLSLNPPKQWTVASQRALLQKLRVELRNRIDRLLAVVPKLDQDGPVVQELETLARCSRLLDQPGDELEQFEQFLQEVDSVSGFVSRLVELESLPRQIERHQAELARFHHLFQQPGLAPRLDELGSPPRLEDSQRLDTWLRRARQVHDTYKAQYRRDHDAFWRTLGEHPLWSWTPPLVGRSRHLGQKTGPEAWQHCRDQARSLRCQGLSNLDFQSRCACGFDGDQAKASAALDNLARLKEQLEQELTAFFDQREVRARVEQWMDQGLEPAELVEPYLVGREPWPTVRNLLAFDEFLDGVEAVTELPAEPVLELLARRTWDRNSLSRSFQELLASWPAEGLRFKDRGRQPQSVTLWCVEQALRAGVPLPDGMGDLEGAATKLEPAWVSAEAGRRLEQLGLSEPCLFRILRFYLDGEVSLPSAGEDRSPLVSALAELVTPTVVRQPGELAQLVENLYRHDARLQRLAGQAWQARLDELAQQKLEPCPLPLTEQLARHRDASWVVIDAWGAPLAGPLLAELENLFPQWRQVETAFAQVEPPTTTDEFFRGLVDAGEEHPLEKNNVIDELLHGDFLPLPQLTRQALQRLTTSLPPIAKRLDPTKPVLLFGDHGFRLDAEGQAWVHGGTSTLERLVPVVRLAPPPAPASEQTR
jgi:hypothetical protein